MSEITVDVALYGSLARFGGGRHFAQFKFQIEAGSCKAELLARLGIPEQERGYLFVNAVLHEVPGMTTGGREPLKDGDHIGIFSCTYMWPYQYRDGIKMSESLMNALQDHGPIHHSYTPVPGEGLP